jgi:hypothetical protein
MTRHLSDDALWDAAEGELAGDARRHLEACVSCRTRVEEAREGIALARSVEDVPEPSPVYWDTFRRQVGQRVAEETPPSWGRSFFARRTLLPAAATAALLIAVALWHGREAPETRVTETTLPAWQALPPSAQDSDLDVLRGVVLAGNDLEDAAPCRDVVDCVASLSDEDSQILADALRDELPEGRS